MWVIDINQLDIGNRKMSNDYSIKEVQDLKRA